jgi:hypothetical protein
MINLAVKLLFHNVADTVQRYSKGGSLSDEFWPWTDGAEKARD